MRVADEPLFSVGERVVGPHNRTGNIIPWDDQRDYGKSHSGTIWWQVRRDSDGSTDIYPQRNLTKLIPADNQEALLALKSWEALE